LTVSSTGLKITTGGLTIVTTEGLAMKGQLTIPGGGIYVHSGITVTSGGVGVTGGVTVNDVGLKVSTGGMSIIAGGLSVKGKLSIEDSGILVISNGISIVTGGLKVTNGLTVSSTGLKITAGGLTIVTTEGLAIKGGLTIPSGGTGIYVHTGGLTVMTLGVKVTGGLSVNDVGLVVRADGVSIVASGMRVTGGVSVLDTGLAVAAGGATIAGTSGLFVSEGGVSMERLGIAGGGMLVADGLIISSSGLYVTGGLTSYGNIHYSGGISYLTSDRRLKTNLDPIVGALHKVSRLNGVYFNWITNEPSGLSYDRDRHIGLIAQEVQAVIPEAVSPVEEGKYLGVDYVSMIPVVIEAIRELDELWKEGKVTMSERTQLRTGLLAELTLVFNNLTSRLDALDQSLVDFKAKAALLSSRLDELQYW